MASDDENYQVSSPQATISSAITRTAIDMVLDLLSIPRDTFGGKTITTGATASNILGLSKSFCSYLLNVNVNVDPTS